MRPPELMMIRVFRLPNFPQHSRSDEGKIRNSHVTSQQGCLGALNFFWEKKRPFEGIYFGSDSLFLDASALMTIKQEESGSSDESRTPKRYPDMMIRIVLK